MLLGNYSVFHKSPGRFLAGQSVSNLHAALSKPGMVKNRYLSDQGRTFDLLSSKPEGYTPGSGAWVIARTAGGMSSFVNCRATFSIAGNGASGFNIDGPVNAVFAFNSTGQLIASATGSSSMVFAFNGTVIATLGVPGSISFAVTANATPTAIGWMVGPTQATFTFSAVSYAVGNMIGAWVASTGLTPQSLAEAVWGTQIEGTYTALEVNRIIAAALAGKVSGSGTNAPVFRSLTDTKDRITATTDVDGNRLSITLDAT